MAIIADTVGADNLAKSLGVAILFTTAGMLCGPALSGALYQFTSYSVAWASSFIFILLGVVFQLLIIKPQNDDKYRERQASRNEENVDSRPSSTYSGQFQERNPLLSSSSLMQNHSYQSLPEPQDQGIEANDSTEHQPPRRNVYWLMLCKKRVIMALVADALFAILISSFETTLPIHIKAAFHWEALEAGLLFLLIQVPSFILVLPAGWLKDRIGMRYPVTAGFTLLAPFMWLLGVPGDGGLKWAGSGRAGQIIYITALVGVGIFRVLPLGFGAFEVLSESHWPIYETKLLIPCSLQMERMSSAQSILAFSALTGDTPGLSPCLILHGRWRCLSVH